MGSIQPATGYAIPFAEWPEEVKQYYRYDPEAAEKLLDEAGVSARRGRHPISRPPTRSSTPPVSGHHELVQGYLAEIGVEVAIRQSDWPTFQASFQKGDYEGMGNWSQGTPYRPLIYSTPPLRRAMPINVPGLSDPEYDSLIEQLQVAPTEEEYQRLGREADFWAGGEPHLPVGRPESLVQRHPAVGSGFRPATSTWGVWNKNAVYARLWIDQALKEEMGG